MFRQARNRGATGATQRKAILDRVYEDNLRLREPGYCAPKGGSRTRRAPNFIAAASLVLMAAVGTLPQQAHNMPMQSDPSIVEASMVSAPQPLAAGEVSTLPRMALAAPADRSLPPAAGVAGAAASTATTPIDTAADASDLRAVRSEELRVERVELDATRPAEVSVERLDSGPARPAEAAVEPSGPTPAATVDAARNALPSTAESSKPAGQADAPEGGNRRRATLATAPPAAFVSDQTEQALELAPLLQAGNGQPTMRELFGLSIRTIVIDAGHGGHDPGALGRTTGIQEKDLTLDIARRLKERLARNSQYRILLVRDSDTFVTLKDRASFANARETDLFVSLHVNFMTGTSTNAVETYYFGRYSDARTRKLAQRENAHSSYALSEFEELVRGMQDRMKLHESRKLAKAIQASLLGNIRKKHDRVLDTGVKTAPFAVLLGVKAPSVLAEIGNLNSPQAEESLADPAYRDAIAAYLAAGITAYLTNQSQEADIHHVQVENGIAGN